MHAGKYSRRLKKKIRKFAQNRANSRIFCLPKKNGATDAVF